MRVNSLRALLLLSVVVSGTGGAALAADGSLANKVDARLIAQLDALHANATNDAQAAADLKTVHPRAVARTANINELAVRINAVVAPELLLAISATGAKITSSAPQWNTVCVLATLSQIDALSQLGAINTIKLMPRPRARQQGIAANQGDGIMHADSLRTQQNLSGAGQIVGVLSDSVVDTPAVGSGSVSGSAPNAIVTGTIPQTDNGPAGTHDLPSSFQVVDFGPGGGTDEGEGMMEVIHDVAPAAALVFASAGSDQTTMAANITSLRTAGNCTVTCDDIGFGDEPFFQDGPIAQAIASNEAAGIAHFSAFGNDANQGVLTTYKSINPAVTTDDGNRNPVSGNCLHDWGNGIGAFLPINVPDGDTVSLLLQWDQPWSSFNLGPGSSVDLDLYLCSAPNLGSIIDKSEQNQGTTGLPSGDAMEEIDYSNSSGNSVTVYLAINHHAGSRIGSTGSGGNVMRIVFDDDGAGALPTINPVGGNSISSYGHPTSPSCIGVGAVDYQIPNTPEPFSSKGGIVPFYFDTTGNPSAVMRATPDIAACDDVDTSVFPAGPGNDSDNSGFPNFSGTSCAAPNAAAVAALLLQFKHVSPAQLLAVLRSSATDITVAPLEDTGEPMAGNDNYTGAGLINATQAFTLLNSIVTSKPVITSPLTATGTVGEPFNYVITATGANPITYSATNLPPGLVSNGASILGLPTVAGTYSVTISATNAGGTASLSLEITIAPGVPPQFSSTSSISVFVNQPFVLPVTTTGSAPITLTAGSLPPGVTFTLGYILSGQIAVAGTYGATITATNPYGTAQQFITITVSELPADQDADGDGVPNGFEQLLGSNPFDPHSTPFAGNAASTGTQLFALKHLDIKLGKTGGDRITLTGSLPLSQGYSVAGEQVVYYGAGVLAKMQLNKTGSGSVLDKDLKVRISQRKSSVGTQNAQFSLDLKGNYKQVLAQNGFDGKSDARFTVYVLFFHTIFYQTVQYNGLTHQFTLVEN